MAKKQAQSNGWRNRIIGHGAEAPDQLLAHPDNWRIHPKYQQDALSAVLDNIGWVTDVIVSKNSGRIVDGHLRVSLAISRNETEVPVVYVDLTEDEELTVLATIDPLSAMAATDSAKLAELLASVQTDDAALDAVLRGVGETAGLIDGVSVALPDETPARPSLADRFIVPPFSVLDARQGYWQERKRQWLSIGIQSEISRSARPFANANDTRDGRQSGEYTGGDVWLGASKKMGAPTGRAAGLMGSSAMDGPWVKRVKGEDFTGLGANSSGTSIFDPVLCELAYRWFTPDGAAILDPFAGGSVRGIVAALLGKRYTGIDLRAEQLEANEAQASVITPDNAPRWIQGDSQHVGTLAPAEYDFVFSCPPYFDLEIYSDDPADLSNMTYGQFADVYRRIIAEACAMLRPDRFACFVVGDVRDKRGNYRDFPGLTIEAFQAAGLSLYNEAILVTSVGSLPIRVGKQMESGRKLGKTHQNVLVFVKGDGKKAAQACGAIEFHFPAEMTEAADG